MRLVDLDELYQLALSSKWAIWEKAKSVGRDVKLYLHWTAGRFNQTFDDYHINITGDGKIYVSTDDLSETLSHTWKRNTGAIGITLCACYGATTNDLGDYPPTQAQIESMAQVVAVLAKALDITIDKYHVMTHTAAADNYDGLYQHEPYGLFNGCERFDISHLGTEESPHLPSSYDDPISADSVLKGKAIWYFNQLY